MEIRMRQNLSDISFPRITVYWKVLHLPVPMNEFRVHDGILFYFFSTKGEEITDLCPFFFKSY